MEEWKIIKEATNYEVSNTGKIRNSITKKILKGRMTKNGYEQVSLKMKDTNGFRNQYIHRLVAQYWVENPLLKKEVNHKDGNKNNNHYLNLEWVTPSENSLHRVHFLKNIPKGKKIGQYNKNNELIQIFNSVEEAASFFNKTRQNIDNALHNKKGQKTAYGFIWKYLD